MKRRSRDDGEYFANVSGNCLAFASDVYRRCVINHEDPARVASALGFSRSCVRGVIAICKSRNCCPTKERLALCAMRTPDTTDADCAEWFGETLAWAKDVRARADEIRAAEPFDILLEYYDPGFQPGDPTQEEIAERCAEVRAKRAGKTKSFERGNDVVPPRQGIRIYAWDRGANAFVQSVPR